MSFSKTFKKKKCKTALINSIYVDFSLNKNSRTECKFYKSYVQKNFILKEGQMNIIYDETESPVKKKYINKWVY